MSGSPTVEAMVSTTEMHKSITLSLSANAMWSRVIDITLVYTEASSLLEGMTSFWDTKHHNFSKFLAICTVLEKQLLVCQFWRSWTYETNLDKYLSEEKEKKEKNL